MEVKKINSINEKDLSYEEQERLFNSVVRGQDITEKIETSRGVFEIKFPRMRDLEKIGRILAARKGGLPSSSFDEGIAVLMNQVATLDVLTITGPAWFENAKKDNDNFSFNEIPDQKFIQELYEKVYSFRLKTQKIFEENKKRTDTNMAANVDVKNSDSPELFDGLSGSTGASR